MIESALEWQLKLLRWQLFATLTWDSVEETTPSQRNRHVRNWLERWTARICQLNLNHVAWVTRWERGELGDRPHCHLLICGLPTKHIHLTTCFRSRHDWEHKYPCICKPRDEMNSLRICRHGIAQVRLYEPSKGGEAYMAKGKFSASWAQGANAYELKKFNSENCDSIYFSPKAQELMLAKRSQVERPILVLS